MARKRMIFFCNEYGGSAFRIARPVKKRPKKMMLGGYQELPLPKPTHHAPCSVEKVDVMAARLARGEALFHPDDFVPTDPVMIERYVFNGRRASAYKVAELLASSPRVK